MHSIRSLVTRRALMAGAVIALGALGTTGTVVVKNAAATAAPSPSANAPNHAATGAGRRPGHGVSARTSLGRLVALEAKDTGRTPAQIRDALGKGQTLTQVAGAAAGQVRSDALAAIKARLDKAVAAKRVTQTRADALLAKAGRLLDTIMSKDLSARIAKQHARRAAGKAGHTRGAAASGGATAGSTSADAQDVLQSSL